MAKYTKLDVIQSGIETDARNYTRFLLIQLTDNIEKTIASDRKPNMATISFNVKDEVGSLYDCLGVFREIGLSLSRLESRPIQGSPWKYMFYADVTLSEKDDGKALLQNAENLLKKYAEEVKVLGIYSEIN